MKKVLVIYFWVLVGAAMGLSIHSANNVSNNLKSIEEKIDSINNMLNDMSTNAEKNNKILKELIDG